MKLTRQFAFASLIIGILMVLVVPRLAQVQCTITVTITEEDINSSFRITNPVRITISNRSVDLQPGQAVVTATYTPRRPTNGMTSYTIETTLVPSINDGRVTWRATSVVINGNAVTNQQLEQANNAVLNAWRKFQNNHLKAQVVTDLTITDIDMTYTVLRGA